MIGINKIHAVAESKKPPTSSLPLNFPYPWLSSIFLLYRIHLLRVPTSIFRQIWGQERKKKGKQKVLSRKTSERSGSSLESSVYISDAYLTVAATWKTILTCLVKRALSLGSMPNPGSWQSPVMAMILWRNFGWSRFTRSKICEKNY